jgi:hypothetical protein
MPDGGHLPFVETETRVAAAEPMSPEERERVAAAHGWDFCPRCRCFVVSFYCLGCGWPRAKDHGVEASLRLT